MRCTYARVNKGLAENNVERWNNAWGAKNLLRGPLRGKRLPARAGRFITTYGLPKVVIFEGPDDFEIRFSPLTRPIRSFGEVVDWGDFPDAKLKAAWSKQLILAAWESCSIHASFCVHQGTGVVTRIDAQSDVGVQFVNSSVPLFARSLLAAVEWSAGQARGTFEELSASLKKIDAKVVPRRKGFWPTLLRYWMKIGTAVEITADPRRSRPRF